MYETNIQKTVKWWMLIQHQNKITVLSFEFSDLDEKISVNVISSEELLKEYVEMQDILEWLELLKNEYKGITKLGIESIQWKVMGLRGSDIAKLYGVKPNNVGAWISRAVKKIRDNPVFNTYMEELIDSKS